MTSPLAVEVKGVTRVFPGQVNALAGVDLTVADGETVAITGPSGCGKSTLLHLLAAIDSPSSGSVIVGGQDLAQIRDLSRYRRNEVGLVFQFHNLLPQLSALANVEVPMFGTHRSTSPANGSGQRAAGPSRPGGMRESPAHGALRRGAPAGGHCPGPGERAADSLGR